MVRETRTMAADHGEGVVREPREPWRKLFDAFSLAELLYCLRQSFAKGEII
jgi:hypothetical protein